MTGEQERMMFSKSGPDLAVTIWLLSGAATSSFFFFSSPEESR